MAKVSGLGDTVSVDDSGGSARDISNDVTDFSINLPQNLLDVAGVDKSAQERLIGLSDGTVTLNGVFDPASNKAHHGHQRFRYSQEQYLLGVQVSS